MTRSRQKMFSSGCSRFQKDSNVYEHVISNAIDRKYWPRTCQLFQQVCLTERPLLVTEMRYALVAQYAFSFLPRIKCCEDTRLRGDRQAAEIASQDFTRSENPTYKATKPSSV